MLGGECDDEFPDEVLVMVCCNLNVRELGRLGCVARRFTRPMGTQAGSSKHKLLVFVCLLVFLF